MRIQIAQPSTGQESSVTNVVEDIHVRNYYAALTHLNVFARKMNYAARTSYSNPYYSVYLDGMFAGELSSSGFNETEMLTISAARFRELVSKQ